MRDKVRCQFDADDMSHHVNRKPSRACVLADVYDRQSINDCADGTQCQNAVERIVVWSVGIRFGRLLWCVLYDSQMMFHSSIASYKNVSNTEKRRGAVTKGANRCLEGGGELKRIGGLGVVDGAVITYASLEEVGLAFHRNVFHPVKGIGRFVDLWAAECGE